MRHPGHFSWRRFEALLDDCRVIAVDASGCIMCGTSAGLARFDGRRFVSFGKAHGLWPTTAVCSMAVSPGNLVWIGTDSGVVASWDGSRFDVRPRAEGMKSPVTAVLPQPDGSVLSGSADGLCIVDGHRSEVIARAEVTCIFRNRRGYTWIGTTHGLHRLDGTRLSPVDERAGIGASHVSAITEDVHANLWIASSMGITRFDGARATTFASEHGIPRARIAALTIDSRGMLWFGTIFCGAGCFDGNAVTAFTTRNGLPHDNVSSIAEDREGSIWIACLRGGVAQLGTSGLAPVVAHPVAEALAPSRTGTAWWGRHRTLVRLDRATCRDCHTFHGTIRGIMEDVQGRLWAATDGGLWVFPDALNPGTAPARPVPLAGGSAIATAWNLHQDARGRIWLADFSLGLCRYEEQAGNMVRVPEAEPFGGCTNLASDHAGNVWLAGCDWRGVGLFDGKDLRRFTTQDGLPDDCATSVAVTRDGTVWAGTSRGVAVFDGRRFRQYGVDDGLPAPFVQRVMVDRRGTLWIATLGGGVGRFDGRNFQVLTDEDGLPSNCVTGIAEDGEGNIIIATYRGVCRYIPDYRSLPQVHIDRVEAERVHEPAGRVRIPDSAPSVRIRFHGVSLKTRRMRYTYIMEGVDREWRSTWAEEVRYEGLPRGSYTFRVSAINRDLVYSSPAAVVSIAVEEDPLDERLRSLEKEVRTLSGMLPICSVCKSIRNESGQWERMESYVMRRSKADFTHGYCPECAARLMDEVRQLLPGAQDS